MSGLELLAGETYRVENRNAVVMVEVRINVVDTNGIHTQDLHQSSVSKATIFVGQRIGGSIVTSTAARLVGNTNDLISVTSGIVDKEISLHVDGGDGSNQRDAADKTQQGLAKL